MKKITKKESALSLRLLTIEATLTSFIIFMPVAYLLFSDIGLSQFQIGLIQFVFAITMLLTQVPTGYMADKFSRKASNFSGDIFLGVAVLIYFFAGNFWHAVIAEILFGLGLSLTNGADSALIKGHAENLGKDYKKINARLSQYAFIAQGLGAIVGGLMGAHNIRWPFLAQAIIFIIAASFSLFIKNIGKKRVTKIHPIKDAYAITKYCLHGHKKLAWRMLLGASLLTSTWVIVWLLTPSFLKAGVPIGWHGVMFALISVAAVFGGQFIIKNPKLKKTTPFLFAGLAYVTLSLNISMFTILIFLMTSFARGINQATVKPYIQEEVAEDIQATALSVFDMLYRVFSASLGLLVNYVGNFGVQFGMMACFGVTATMFLIFKLNGKRYV
ncbi:MAG TPA: MFS transporter [Candidatus Saccharibacteria bacterium]|jgi:MFS family permease|nr:MFS transporter [Candidatus Saccharibacteria bacterium]